MSEPANQKSEIEHRLSAGHFKKAEAALARLVSSMSPEEFKSEELELRVLSSKFLPKHKARYGRLEAQLAAKCNPKPLTREVPESPSQVREDAISKQELKLAPKLELSLVELQEREFQALVNEMRPFRFTQSIQVSNYIKRNHLETRYRHITGVGTFTNRDGTEWELAGAISKSMFGRVCDALGLSHKGTSARLTRFVPYSALGR